MKKILFLFIFNILMGHSLLVGQCSFYGHFLNIKGFACETTGEICFKTNLDWLPLNEPECYNYSIEIKFPTDAFIVTDFGDFSFFNQNATSTFIRYQPPNIFDAINVGCLSGNVLIPNTTFSYRLVNNDNPNDVILEENFIPDGVEVVGQANQETLLSSALGTTLLPTNEAFSNGQRIRIEGTLVVDQNYRFGTGGPVEGRLANDILMGENARIEIREGNTLEMFQGDIHSCQEGVMWDRINIEKDASFLPASVNISDAEVAIEMQDLSRLGLLRVVIFDSDIGIGSFGLQNKELEFILGGSFSQGVIRDSERGCVFQNVDMVNFNGYINFINIGLSGIQLDNSGFNGNNVRFYDCQTGILSNSIHDDILVLNNGDFTSCSYGIFARGNLNMNITNTTFIEQSVDIFKMPNTFNEHTAIEHNFFIQSGNNILATTNFSSANIRHNHLAARNGNVALFGIDPDDHRWIIEANETLAAIDDNTINVLLNNTRNAEILDNDFGTLATTLNFLVAGGSENVVAGNYAISDHAENIRIFSSNKNLIACNTFDGDNGAIVLNNSNGSKFRGNTFSSSGINLQYGSLDNTFGSTGPHEY